MFPLAWFSRATEADLSSLKERRDMLEETILAKDNIIMALSTQLENMQEAAEALPPAPKHPPKDLIDFSESYHETLKVTKYTDFIVLSVVLYEYFYHVETRRGYLKGKWITKVGVYTHMVYYICIYYIYMYNGVYGILYVGRFCKNV